MSVTQMQLKQHFLNLGSNGALYVWGANGQIITEELMDKLHKSYGTSKYSKQYYANKLKAGKGKIAADCSGALHGVSGYDDTAAGYYNRCVEKGKISSIPQDKVCLVFKQNSSGSITHVGCYTGDGYVSEMASSALNYQRKKLANNGWDLWGMPDFVSDNDSKQESATTTTTTKASDTKMKQIKRGSKGKAVRVWQAIVGVDIDGMFGAKTKDATLKFQKKAFPKDPKEWDGIVGEKTWKAGLESIK